MGSPMQNFRRGGGPYTHRYQGDFISLFYSFKEGKQAKKQPVFCLSACGSMNFALCMASDVYVFTEK
jgi:hypothetical protein